MALIKREEIRKFILISMGWPTISCELKNPALDMAIDMAITEYLSVGAFEKEYKILRSPVGDNKINLTDYPEIGTISNVVYPVRANQIAGSTSDIFSFAISGSEVGPNFTNFIHAAGNVAAFFEYIQNRNRVIGEDITFKVLDNTLYIWPMPKVAGNLIIEYSKNAFQLEKDNCISTSNSWGTQWIRKFSLAYSKQMLGQIRSKFSQVSGGPNGEAQTLNGPALLAESAAEMAALREELGTHHSHTQFFIA